MSKAKMTVRFKEPDEIGNAVYELCRPTLNKLVKAGMDEDDARESSAYEKESAKWDEFFEFGDYGCVEFTINADATITGRLLPREEWS